MPFSRFVQVGRVCVVCYGADEGKLCTIVEIVDQNEVCSAFRAFKEPCARAVSMQWRRRAGRNGGRGAWRGSATERGASARFEICTTSSAPVRLAHCSLARPLRAGAHRRPGADHGHGPEGPAAAPPAVDQLHGRHHPPRAPEAAAQGLGQGRCRRKVRCVVLGQEDRRPRDEEGADRL